MKKVILTFFSLALVSLSLPIGGVLAAEKEGIIEGPGINLDEYINNSNSGKIGNTAPSKDFTTFEEGPDGGGWFEVVWGGDRHTSIYDHDTKEHRSSASNFTATEYSDWKIGGSTASVWVKSSWFGNKANWSTR